MMAGQIVANQLNTDTGVYSTNNAYTGVAKAWCNFNATGGTITVRASYNVSSLVRNSTGYYTLNFATTMTDANYCVQGLTSSQTAGNPQVFAFCSAANGSSPVAPTTSAFSFVTANSGSATSYDPVYTMITVNGN
jgi:hypothetical protein